MKIRVAKTSDKSKILQFCQNTFSWGDYIENVWDSWYDEENLFVADELEPVGICHGHFSQNQVWIEGIRVNPEFRRKKIATKLIKHVESIATNQKILNSFMLIDVENISSLNMVKKLGYTIFQTWNFYSISPKSNCDFKINFNPKNKLPEHYVKSWRWIPLDNSTKKQLYSQKQIVSSEDNSSFCIITNSEHFDKTMIITFFSNDECGSKQLLNYIQNFSFMENSSRVQIITKEMLPKISGLEKRICFHLVKKQLN